MISFKTQFEKWGRLQNRRPLLFTVLAFIVVVTTATILTVWWNVLLVQNHRILTQMTAAATAAANDPSRANIPLAILILIGILCSLVILCGLLYMFLRLIKSVRMNIAQSQFIAGVTHELRSPVASLQIMLETIRDPTTSESDRKEFEQCMSIDLKRLKMLVDQVLESARLENTTQKPVIEKLRLTSLLETCRQNIDTRLRTTQSNLEIFPFHENTTVEVNRDLFINALSNVLDNAIKYSTNSANISIKVHDGGSKRIRIEIRDQGIGINRKETRKIFRRFYRGGSITQRQQTGTGLGLYFSKIALTSMGGDISATSDGIGLGSTFWIEITKA